LLNPSTFRDLVSGRRRGPVAAVLRCALRMAEVPYTWAVAWRNRRYDSGAAAVERVDVPVVSVGNLTLGGTGKTPMVEWLARWFAGRGVRVAVISRGYGAKAGAENDEALELKQRLPEVPHLQNPDRVSGAREAVERFGCQAIVLDDAFQHRRIARDLDIVMLDALEPFGFGHVFPRGTLREPVAGLRRADVVVLSRADLLDAPGREEIRCQVQQLAPQAAWAEVVHAPRALITAAGQEEPLASLQGTRLAAFCGVGNPAGFRHTLQASGYHVAGFRAFPDHHRYTPGDVAWLAAWAERLGATALVCTHKDLVKLGCQQVGRRPLWAVRVALEFLSEGEGKGDRSNLCQAGHRPEVGRGPLRQIGPVPFSREAFEQRLTALLAR